MIANRSTVRGNARAKVITSAWTLIADGGVGSFSMREAADAAGVSLGTVTYHFKNREELVDASFSELVARHTAIGAIALRRVEHESREVAARLLLEALRDLWGDRVTALAGAELRIHASRSATARADASSHRASGMRVIGELHAILGRSHSRRTIEAVSDLLDAKVVRLAGRHRSATAFAAAVRRHLDALYVQT